MEGLIFGILRYFHLKGRTFWLIKELEEFEGTF